MGYLFDRKATQSEAQQYKCKIAIRVARGYRTISFEAATILACCLPFHILVEVDAKIYERRREMDLEPEALRQLAHRQALILWRMRLELFFGVWRKTHANALLVLYFQTSRPGCQGKVEMLPLD
ncbi:jg25923 [Pararge aegeria aegeria]|uniref:Jg25923 protein n=1 Tax=Pararge aegeria aegeria TaxID=348720 RepID=A0A8S4QR63_9NEOP|nr:jg25923 [Pararge aegeria aegeria]